VGHQEVDGDEAVSIRQLLQPLEARAVRWRGEQQQVQDGRVLQQQRKRGKHSKKIKEFESRVWIRQQARGRTEAPTWSAEQPNQGVQASAREGTHEAILQFHGPGFAGRVGCDCATLVRIANQVSGQRGQRHAQQRRRVEHHLDEGGTVHKLAHRPARALAGAHPKWNYAGTSTNWGIGSGHNGMTLVAHRCAAQAHCVHAACQTFRKRLPARSAATGGERAAASLKNLSNSLRGQAPALVLARKPAPWLVLGHRHEGQQDRRGWRAHGTRRKQSAVRSVQRSATLDERLRSDAASSTNYVKMADEAMNSIARMHDHDVRGFQQCSAYATPGGVWGLIVASDSPGLARRSLSGWRIMMETSYGTVHARR